MNRLLFFALIVVLPACRHAPGFLRRGDGNDSLYSRAVAQLDAANKLGSLDSAITLLDAYLASGSNQEHRGEALVLRQLARDSRQLARVEVALAQAKGDSTHSRPGSDADAKRREEEAVKEIQRLKDELAKANEELDRIRKRLATPKPPTGL